MADCKKCRFRSICKKRPKMEGATIAECDLFRNDIERTEPMTNADRIRAMSDEELEAFLIDVDLDNAGSPFINEWGKWLKQPAEEGIK